MKNKIKRITLILVLILTGSSILYFTSLRPERFGFYRDDSIYVVMAKALATDQGYRLLSLPNEPVQTKSPPFYPFLLSLIWRLYPQFPENLTLMMLLSVAANIGFLAMTWRYLVKQGYAKSWQALIIVSLVAINWRTMALATGIYSEMIYAALSVVVLYQAEKYEKEKCGWGTGVILGVVMGLAFLTRSAGLALLIAVAAYYLLKRRWKRGWLPVAVGLVFVVGWLAWGYINSLTVESINAASYESYFHTFNEVLMNTQEENNTSKMMVFLSLIGKNALGLILVSIPVVCLGLSYEWAVYFVFAFLFIAAGFSRHISKGIRLLHIYLICYLALHLLWPYSSYDRFLMPLIPFLLLYLVMELEMLVGLVRRELASGDQLIKKISAAFIGLALLVSVGTILFNYGLSVQRSLASVALKKSAKPAIDDAEAIEWITANTDSADVLICYRDPMYYLYTGRKATRSSLLREGGSVQGYKGGIDERAKSIFRIIGENNGRYLILTPSDFDLEYLPEQYRSSIETILKQHPEKFVLVFESTNGRSKIYRIER